MLRGGENRTFEEKLQEMECERREYHVTRARLVRGRQARTRGRGPERPARPLTVKPLRRRGAKGVCGVCVAQMEALSRPLSPSARALDARTYGHKCLTAFPRDHRLGTPSDWRENRTVHKFGPSAWPPRKGACPPDAVHAPEKRGRPPGRASCTPGGGQAQGVPERQIFSWPYFKNVEI